MHGFGASFRALAIALSETGVYVAGVRQPAAESSAFLARFPKNRTKPSKPQIHGSCVVNAASYEMRPGLAPGEIVAIFGTGIGPATLVPAAVTAEQRLSAEVADTRVLFNGVAAPLIYVSDAQTAAIVPYGVAGAASVNIEVEYNGARSGALHMPVVVASPGVFGVVLNEDGTVNSATSPALPDSILTIFATGEGLTDPLPVDGTVAGRVPPNPRLPVSVVFSQVSATRFEFVDPNAQILYAGGVSGAVAGLLQVNLRLPRLASGIVPDGFWQFALRIGVLQAPLVGVFVR